MASKAEQARRDAEREEALHALRGYLRPGDTVYTIRHHTSASGTHVIGTVILGDRALYNVTHLTARALDMKIHPKHYGVVVGGCGMDMGFHVVYSLSRALWPNGHPCTGEDDGPHRCPSNAHTNGLRVYDPATIHPDGGFALNHRWL
jgi:hypothetical protein